MIIMTIIRHMPGQLIYPSGKQRHLNLGGTSVSLLKPKLVYNLGLLPFVQTRFPFSLLNKIVP